jgi:PKD repeat protein
VKPTGKLSRSVILTALALSVACTTSQTTVPPVSGPSELALSLRLVAVPDSITQDGASQASIEVTAFDANGKTCAGLPVRMDMAVGGVIQDFGTLSARTIVTGSDGKARAIYTAAPPPPPSTGGSGTTVLIVATPSSSVNCGSNQAVGNFDGTSREQVAIRLVPAGVILSPAGPPTAAFAMSPDKAVMNAAVAFDASASQPGTGASQITSYSWNFGDGTSTASGRTVTHAFTSQQTFLVTLTVTNDRGLSASTSVPTPVTAPAFPVADFVFGPTPIHANASVNFTSTSTTPSGFAITGYSWDFGDGTSACSTPTCTHTYPPVAPTFPATTVDTTYNVTLTVTDGSGLSAKKTNPVVVTSP